MNKEKHHVKYNPPGTKPVRVGYHPNRPNIPFDLGGWDELHIIALIHVISLEDSQPAYGGISGKNAWLKVVEVIKGAIETNLNPEKLDGLKQLLKDTQSNETIDQEQVDECIQRFLPCFYHESITNKQNNYYLVGMKLLFDYVRDMRHEYATNHYEVIRQFVQTWLKGSKKAIDFVIMLAIAEVLEINFILLDKAREDYQNTQRSTNRHNKRYKVIRDFLDKYGRKQLDWAELLVRAKVWVNAYIVHDNEITAIREQYNKYPSNPRIQSGQLTRADSYVLEWYKKFKVFNDALL
ncbi:MAG: hypothetical protein R6U37_07035 [Dehalococcoidia bacterium]